MPDESRYDVAATRVWAANVATFMKSLIYAALLLVGGRGHHWRRYPRPMTLAWVRLLELWYMRRFLYLALGAELQRRAYG